MKTQKIELEIPVNNDIDALILFNAIHLMTSNLLEQIDSINGKVKEKDGKVTIACPITIDPATNTMTSSITQTEKITTKLSRKMESPNQLNFNFAA